MSLYPEASSSKHSDRQAVGITEFEILKASHQFLRNEDEKPTSWNDKLAGKYYSNLYREFAVCDLKHYKSGNFALRWRTEEEVLSGAGETTCGNTRCEHHFALSRYQENLPLTTLELPFAYIEHGQTKSALVKVVLCSGCVKKLMYKRTKVKSAVSTPREGDDLRSKRRDEDESETTRQRSKKRQRDGSHEPRKEKTSRRRSKTPEAAPSVLIKQESD